MSEDSSSPLQICPACGAEVDVAEFEPLASVECPVCGSPMVVGKTLGQYELVEVMGRGGMGVVYRAIDHQLDRQVALKVLRNDFSGDAEFIQKLEEEASITAGINHPHVVKVYTTGTAGGRFYLAMELVDKGTLDDLLGVQGRVAESQALEIASQIAQGLRAAHSVGLIHRDVKPGNILFAENHQAKIVDFGLAMLEEASKGSDEIWGTPYYVSPERLDQKPEDFRSDIYSLGATIFHAIAGRPPFEAQDASHVALKHLKSQAVSLQAFAPWVSGSTAFVINRTLNKDPAARYDSYDEFIEHLEYARHELGAAGAQPAAKKRVVLETDEDRKLWGQITFAVLGLVLLLAIGTGTYFLFFAPKEESGSALSNSVHATGKHAADFEAARKLLLENKPAEAAAAFHQIAVGLGRAAAAAPVELRAGGARPFAQREPAQSARGDGVAAAAQIHRDRAGRPAAGRLFPEDRDARPRSEAGLRDRARRVQPQLLRRARLSPGGAEGLGAGRLRKRQLGAAQLSVGQARRRFCLGRRIQSADRGLPGGPLDVSRRDDDGQGGENADRAPASRDHAAQGEGRPAPWSGGARAEARGSRRGRAGGGEDRAGGRREPARKGEDHPRRQQDQSRRAVQDVELQGGARAAEHHGR